MSNVYVVRRKARPIKNAAEREPAVAPPRHVSEEDDESALDAEMEDDWRHHSNLEGCQNMVFRR
jgi:hypothetical protein